MDDRAKNNEVRRLVELLAGLPLRERPARLDAEQPSPEVRRAVLAMLDADGERTTLPDVPPGDPHAGDTPVAAYPGGDDSPVGLRREMPETIDGYRVLRVLGEGGFGIVYLCEQTEPVRRRVAVKLLKPGRDSHEVLARFEAEKQAMARMEHPCIATIFGAGTSERGHAYFAMEYVKGEPITRYCDLHRLTMRERLELFKKVALAVHHAHRRGIIHRDLKPSNILVGISEERTPFVKIIDFGVAKAVNPSDSDRSLITQAGQIVGTPEYMSPEQAEMGETDIDTRSDIYSLGVLLYELIAGVRPFDLREAGELEMRRYIRDVDPPRPSKRLSSLGETATVIAERHGVSLPDLTRLLRSELDWIPLHALQKDRSKRYDSAGDFARDIQNYLDDLPLIARPDSGWYLFRKFVRRHRVAATLAAVIAVSVLVSIAGLGVGYSAARGESVRANRAAELAEQRYDQLMRFVTMPGRFSESSGPYSAPARRELVRTVTGMLDELGADGLDPQLRRDLSVAFREAGLLALTSDSTAEAIEAFEQARRLAEGLEQTDASDRIDAMRLGVGYARALSAAERDGDAERVLAEVLGSGPPQAGHGLERARADLATAEAFTQMALVHARSRRLDAAEDSIDRAFARLDRHAVEGEHGAALGGEIAIASAEANECASYIADLREDREASIDHAGRAVDALRRFPPGERSPAILRACSEAQERLFNRVVRLGQLEEAKRLADAVRELADRRVGLDPGDTDAIELRERTHEMHGELAVKRGDLSAAEAYFRRFASGAAELHGQDPLDIRRLSMVTVAESRLGTVCAQLGKPGDAAIEFRRALARLETRFGEGLQDGPLREWALRIAYRLSHAYRSKGDVAGAEQTLRRGADHGEAIERGDALTASARNWYGRVLRDLGNTVLRRAESAPEQTGGADGPELTEAIGYLEHASSVDGRREPHILGLEARAYALAGDWEKAVDRARARIAALHEKDAGRTDASESLGEAERVLEAYKGRRLE